MASLMLGGTECRRELPHSAQYQLENLFTVNIHFVAILSALGEAADSAFIFIVS